MISHDGRPDRPLLLLLASAIPIVASLGACGDSPSGLAPLEGGVVATFSVASQEFSLWTDDPVTIADLLQLEAEESQATIPNGKLLQGSGRGDHNAPWSWHMDPDDIEMAEFTAEVCDGRPSDVEDDLDYWLNTVERFCPWGAELVGIQDHR